MKSGFKFEKSEDARVQCTVCAWGNRIFLAQNVKWEEWKKKKENMQKKKGEKNKEENK